MSARSAASQLHVLDRRLLFVTGKGGTGKTTVTAALARLAADAGKRVLVCEAEARGDLADAFECGELSFEPREIAPGLFAMSMDTEAALREYLRLQLHLPTLAWFGPLAHPFEFVATALPGIREILTVGKLCYEVRERKYDLVVVDAAATGHIIGELAAPAGINDLVRVGAIRHQTDWMLEILGDARRTAAVVVATPEEMPVAEAIDLIAHLEERTVVHLGAVVANRVLPELFGRGEAESFAALAEPSTRAKLAASLEVDDRDVEALFDAASHAVQLRRAGAEHLEALRAASSTALLLLPYLFARPSGARAVRVLADALAEELT